MNDAPRFELQSGDVVADRYRVRREIARGGMAAVYEAEHLHLGRRVALKMLTNEAHEIPTVGDRLLREGRALELSRHPNVVEALDSGLDTRVVHRDVKPSNVFVARTRGGTEVTKLIDFGIASIGPGDHTKKLTQAGERLGTYEYMAPEQLLGDEVDHRADIFGVGVTLYEAIVGDVPFPGGPRTLLTTLLSGKAPPAMSVAVPACRSRSTR